MRHPDFRHSDFFYELNYRERWIPFLQGRPAAMRPLTPAPGRVNWRYRTTVVVVALAVLAAGVWLLR